MVARSGITDIYAGHKKLHVSEVLDVLGARVSFAGSTIADLGTVSAATSITSTAITGTTITASTEFRGTVLTSNSTTDIDLKTSGGTQFRAAHAGSAVNFIQVKGSASGSAPSIEVAGSDTDRSLSVSSRGIGSIGLYTNGLSTLQARISHTASAVNYWQLTGGVTGSPGVITASAQGSDSNIDTAINGKGTGTIRLSSHYTRYLTVTGSSASAVTLSATDGNLVLTSAGGGANVTTPLPFAALTGTAIPAGGTAGSGYKFSSAPNFGMFFGSGAPTLAAAQGSIYLRSDGSSTSTRLYVNTDGSTTWTNVTTAA